MISLWPYRVVTEAHNALKSAFRLSALFCLVSLIFILTPPHRFSMNQHSDAILILLNKCFIKLHHILHMTSKHWSSLTENITSVPLDSYFKLWDLDFQFENWNFVPLHYIPLFFFKIRIDAFCFTSLLADFEALTSAAFKFYGCSFNIKGSILSKLCLSPLSVPVSMIHAGC